MFLNQISMVTQKLSPGSSKCNLTLYIWNHRYLKLEAVQLNSLRSTPRKKHQTEINTNIYGYLFKSCGFLLLHFKPDCQAHQLDNWTMIYRRKIQITSSVSQGSTIGRSFNIQRSVMIMRKMFGVPTDWLMQTIQIINILGRAENMLCITPLHPLHVLL